MSSSFGDRIKVSIFGESHGKGIGCVIDGLPSGEKIDLEELKTFMERRAPGKNKYGTKRIEQDKVEFLSGIVDGVITGSPISGIILNKDQKSKDYKNLEIVPRPSHADFTAYEKYKGFADMRGGGHFSGRLTAPICVVGGLAKQILERRNIFVGAHLLSIGNIEDDSYESINLNREKLELTGKVEFPTINPLAAEKMQKLLDRIRFDGDSIGGIIQTAVLGLPVGLGNPIFDGIENNIAKAVFGIPGVKGLDFGAGFEGSRMKGSQYNDDFNIINGKIVTNSNNNGGILGGISNGMPLLMKVAMKPTPSISKEQDSINLMTGQREKLIIKGRHDPCIAVRAVPVVEAVVATVILDFLIEEGYIDEK